MRKFRLFVIVLCAGIIILDLFLIDYQNLISKPNRAAFLGMISMILVILSMVLSNRHENKNQKN